MRRIKVFALYIDPDPKKHGASFRGHVISGDQVGQHLDLSLMKLRQIFSHHTPSVSGLQELERAERNWKFRKIFRLKLK